MQADFNSTNLRKIIHVDMDCFYAAIEIRDRPELADKPVAVGAPGMERGVLCTCNYVARKLGVRSAMSNKMAYQHCKDLIILPVNMAKYKTVAKEIQNIFREYTDLVEPLALDEAFLDVSHSPHHQGSATFIAEAIRKKIWDRQNLTASAGVAPNKFLAKIGSGWNKPNGLFVIRPQDVAGFVKDLEVENLFGVGKVTAKKFHQLRLKTCTDLQKLSLHELTHHFGKLGERLYEQCRGLDSRTVNPNRIRKSLSVEETFAEDIRDLSQCLKVLKHLHQRLTRRIKESTPDHPIKNQFIKIKFSDFKSATMETLSTDTNFERYEKLFIETHAKHAKSIRLIGVGVHFQEEKPESAITQGLLF